MTKLGTMLLVLLPMAGAQELYPKPLVHTPTDHPAERVLLVDVAGLHAFDLARWVESHPRSTLRELTGRGDTFTDVHTPVADPAAGLLALVTGGGPISTGIAGSLGWDRSLAAGSTCTAAGGGAPIDLATPMGGARIAAPQVPTQEVPTQGCKPMEAHNLLRVNTLFEAVHDKLGRTAWAGGAEALTDLLRGPSGKGLDEACVLPDRSADAAGALAGDRARVQAARGWYEGRSCAGAAVAVPVFAGLELHAVGAAQTGPGMGYLDSAGTPNATLDAGMAAVDAGLGEMVRTLKAKGLFDSTWIVVTSSYGSIDPGRTVHMLPLAAVEAAAGKDKVAMAVGGGTVQLWLRRASDVAAVVAALEKDADRLGLAAIATAPRLDLTRNPATADPRTPDLVLTPVAGSAWDGGAAHDGEVFGGVGDDATHVAMLVSGKGLATPAGGRSDKTMVPSTQLAPLLMRVLGMEKFDLDALHHEHTPALPGIF